MATRLTPCCRKLHRSLLRMVHRCTSHPTAMVVTVRLTSLYRGVLIQHGRSGRSPRISARPSTRQVGICTTQFQHLVITPTSYRSPTRWARATSSASDYRRKYVLVPLCSSMVACSTRRRTNLLKPTSSMRSSLQVLRRDVHVRHQRPDSTQSCCRLVRSMGSVHQPMATCR